MTLLPKHLEEIRDELALKKFSDAVYTNTLSSFMSHDRQVFKFGFNQAADLMLKDLVVLAKALESIEQIDIDTHKRHPEYEGQWSEYADVAREALKSYREKYKGEIK